MIIAMKLSNLVVTAVLALDGVQAWVLPQTKRHSSTLSSTYSMDGETIRGPITPLGNFCLVKVKETLTATDGGILLPDQVRFR
jgi:hypothetical protein